MIPNVALEATAPGSNLRDTGRGDNWVLWLPDLDVARAVALGEIPADVVAHLSRGARRFDIGDDMSVDFDDGPIDLLVLTRSALRRVARHSERAAALRQALAPRSTVAVIGRRAASRGPRRQVARLMERPAVRSRPAVLAPAQPRSAQSNGSRCGLAVPLLRPRGALPRPVRRARKASQLLMARLRRVLRASQPAPSTRAHASDPVLLQPRLARRAPSGAALVVTTPAPALSSPPAWLNRLLASAGVADERALSAFAPPRGYRSQKTLFLLGLTPGGSPDLVVKITQEPRFNHRLDAEAAALARVAEGNLVPTGTVPQVVHRGRYSGLSVAIETLCQGVPFRQVSTGLPDCPLAGRALEWLTCLGARTAQPDTRPPEERRAEAEQLVSRFVDTFAPPGHHRDALYHRAAVLADEDVPAVFFHGDPGPWNLVARPDGSIAVLDWENAMPVGPPVWDLMLFLRGFGAFAAAARGERYTAAAFVEQFRPGSELRPLLDLWLTDYGRRVGVGPAAMESLIVLGWVHQALKEVSRLPPRSAASSPHRAAVERLLDDPSLELVTASA